MASRKVRRLFNAVFYPSRFVRGDVVGRASTLYAANHLLVVFFLNLVLYAAPLTMAGFGSVPSDAAPPAVVVAVSGVLSLDPIAAWEFVRRFARNCLYITLGTGLTFVAFHASVVVTRQSAGVLPTLHTVVYSTSAYLAGIFSVVWYLSTSPSIVAADDLLLSIQKRFIYFFIDSVGADLALPTGRPQPVTLRNLTTQGELAVAFLLVLCAYFMYSLYLGSRLNHGASRVTATLTILTVGATPAAFVLGSIAIALSNVPIPIP